MYRAALDGSRQHGSRRLGGRFGVWAGLCGCLLGSACSFNLPARSVCDSGNCTGTDMGSKADLAPDPADPNLMGSYKVATAPITLAQQPALQSGQLFLPSDDSTTLSGRTARYPLVLLAPAQYLDVQQLSPYAQRLASHGIVVALYRPTNESDQVSYRSAGLNLLSYLVNNSEPVVANHLDGAHVGLAGYDLGAEISVSMAAQTPTVRGLFLIDPVVVAALQNPVDGLTDMSQVNLAGGQKPLMLGQQTSKRGMLGAPPCTDATTNYEQFYTKSPAGTLALNFINAAHADFVDAYPDTVCGGGTMAKAETQRLAIKYMTAYFQWTLLERAAAQGYLTGGGFDADAKQYALTRTQK